MEETISLKELFQTLKKRLNLIITITLGFLLVSAILTFFVLTPRYEASTQILVNQSQDNTEGMRSTDVESSRELISTYNVIITSPAILEPVIENTNFNGSISELRSKISVESEEESQVAIISIEDEAPQEAVTLANSVSKTFEERIPQIMEVDNVSILSQAQVSDSEQPVFPLPFLNLFIALVVGLIAGVGIAVLLDFLDKTIKTEKDVESELSLPILGVVPAINQTELKRHTKEYDLKTRINERERKKS